MIDFSYISGYLRRLREQDAAEIREREAWLTEVKCRLGLVTYEDVDELIRERIRKYDGDS